MYLIFMTYNSKVWMCKCQCQMYFCHMYENIGCIIASVGCIYDVRKTKKHFAKNKSTVNLLDV